MERSLADEAAWQDAKAKLNAFHFPYDYRTNGAINNLI
jgi:hypothetical protein